MLELEDRPRVHDPRPAIREQKIELVVVVAAGTWACCPCSTSLLVSAVRDTTVGDPCTEDPTPSDSVLLDPITTKIRSWVEPEQRQYS